MPGSGEISGEVTFLVLSMKKTLLKSVLIFITVLALFAGCTRRNSSSKSPTSIKLNDIESRMFQYPENLDSLISMVDTVNLTQCDIARVYMIKGYFNYWNGNYDTSINELAKADVIFQKVGDNYYTNLNNLIKAFLFELLDLDNNAAKLYVSCNVYFEKNHLEKFKFYSTLGLLRFSKQLNLHKEVLIEVINKAIKELNQPIYSGLYYAALGQLHIKN